MFIARAPRTPRVERDDRHGVRCIPLVLELAGCRAIPQPSDEQRLQHLEHGPVEDEVSVLTYLALKLRELRNAKRRTAPEERSRTPSTPPWQLRELCHVERRMALEETARAAYVHGAEEHSRVTLGRPLTQDELDGVLARYRS